MKHCPECNRNYADPTLSFCLQDGAPLIFGSAVQEPATAILHSTDASAEAPTRAQIHTTARPDVLPSRSDEGPKGFRARTKKIIVAAFAMAIVSLGTLLGFRYFNSASQSQIESIAVLPFENRSGSSDTDYLSDGLADSLIYRLTQLPNLKVSPTSSVMRYKGKETDVARIAEDLNVDAVMSGRLVQRGDDLNISVQLIDTRSQKLLWAEQYDRKMADLLATQREIAATIADKLHLRLVGDQAGGITKKYTNNNEAYQLYLNARFHLAKRDEDHIRKAIEQFKSATNKDPNFALAYAGLADCYNVLPFFSSSIASSEAAKQAKGYAVRAVEIDDSLGEAHTALGYAETGRWEWTEAEKEFKRGIELNPNNANAYKYYGNLLSGNGRLEEALTQFKKAHELEPLSVIILGNTCEEAYLAMGETDAAVRECKKALDLEPNWWFAHEKLGLAYMRQGKNDDALAEAEKAAELSKRQSAALGSLGYIYAKSGRKDDALKLVEELEQRYETGQAEGSDIARAYTGLGDKDQAFFWLERDVQAHSATLHGYIFNVPFDELHAEPRFRDLTRRMRIAP